MQKEIKSLRAEIYEMKKEKETFDEEKENNLAEEIVLLNGKQSGSIREGPH